MSDFFKNVIAGATILFQSVGYMIGVKLELPSINPLSPTPIVITSPAPSNEAPLMPKSAKATLVNSTSPDPDPIIDCNFPQSGTKKMHRSDCVKSTDCQIGDKWYVYLSTEGCKQDQLAYWKSNYQPKTYSDTRYSTYTPTFTSTSPSVPCPNCDMPSMEEYKEKLNEITKQGEPTNYQQYVNDFRKSVTIPQTTIPPCPVNWQGAKEPVSWQLYPHGCK